MKIITTREMRADVKTFFNLAEKERIAVKRGKKYVNLVVTTEPDSKFVSEEWIKEFMSIPMEHRCNPFEVSPSGDLFYADKRNVEKIKKSIQRGLDDYHNGRTLTMLPNETIDEFLLRISPCLE